MRFKWLTPILLAGTITAGALAPEMASAQRYFHTRHHRLHRAGPVLYYGRQPTIYFVGSNDPLFAPQYTYPRSCGYRRVILHRPAVVWAPRHWDYRWRAGW